MKEQVWQIGEKKLEIFHVLLKKVRHSVRVETVFLKNL